ncbi:hypothetical protein LTR36_007300 [Oleoguttula mirabilis]|uniref:Uncharacterized protein n=1 Tax=Oleoguttula mirabilis TaxID=1507867 RepID=A0AAV9JAA6_9PEZI|nr:hypothetical protein LTR36_007300 [Oleoguttula mirabilis]
MSFERDLEGVLGSLMRIKMEAKTNPTENALVPTEEAHRLLRKLDDNDKNEAAEISTQSPTTSSKLMSLPAELRNAIYEYALTEDEITVDSNLKQPALLHTCRQIPTEALGLWYTSGHFVAQVHDCDATLLVAFSQHLVSIGQTDAKLFMVAYGKDWKNLEQWCYAIWSGQCLGLPKDEDADDEEAVIMAAHDCTTRHIGMPWDVCQQALENLKFVVTRLDSEWHS